MTNRFERENAERFLQPLRDVFELLDGRRSFPVNIKDSADKTTFEIILPDVAKDEVEIHVHNSMLHVDVVRKERSAEEIQTKWIKREYFIDSSRRSFQLDSSVYDLQSQIVAKWRDGILEVSIKKFQKAEPVKVNISE